MKLQRSVLALGIALAGCTTGDVCDPDQLYSAGVCYAADAAAPTADADLRYAHLGDVCASAPECAAPTSFCLVLPGEAMGYCTSIGCLTDPTVCPAGWGCLDLSVYQPGLPAICTKP